MLRQSIAFEWRIGDEVEWQEGGFTEVAHSIDGRITETELARVLLRCILLALVALCTAGSLAIPEDQVAQQQADKAVRFALLQEKLLQESGAHHRYPLLVDSNVTTQWQNRWRETWKSGVGEESGIKVTLLAVDRQDELVVATILVEDPAPNWRESRSYREKRFYRLRGQNWLRTMPPPSDWGTLQHIESTYFRLEYHAPDAEVVAQISQQLDPLYTKLYSRLGMEIPNHRDQLRQKQIFAVVPDMINGTHSYQNRVEFTSPTLAPIPAQLTDAEYLLHTIMNRLTYFAVQEAMARTRNGTEYRWNLVLWGVRSWLLHDLLGQPSPWSTEAELALRAQLAEEPYVVLEMLNRGYRADQPTETEIMARYMLAESVVTYALTTHGAERLPILLQDFSIYSRWKDLVPRAFGVSVEEFEAGWQEHVHTTYVRSKPTE